jgi:hypothetical protein
VQTGSDGVPWFEDSELDKLREFIDDDLLSQWTVAGLQAKHKVIMDSLPREKPEVLKATLVGLRNKAITVGGCKWEGSITITHTVIYWRNFRVFIHRPKYNPVIGSITRAFV